jgi:hypothetical protein
MRLSWMLRRPMAGLLGSFRSTGALALGFSYPMSPAWQTGKQGSSIANMSASADKGKQRRRRAVWMD